MALTLVLLLAIGNVAALAEGEGVSLQPGRLDVTARATRTVAPDTVDMTIGVTAQDANQQNALNDVNRIIADVLASLLEMDVPESQIKTSRLDIAPRYSTFSDRRIIGYTASISLNVTLTDFELISAVIETSVELGANNIGSLRFRYSDEGLVYRQALADAVAVARLKAQAMADAAGVELGTLLSLRENSYNAYSSAASYSNMRSGMDFEPLAGSDTQVMAGEIQFSASVDMTYEIK